MKRFLTGLILANLLFSAAEAHSNVQLQAYSNQSNACVFPAPAQQNLIGEVTTVDPAGKITVKPETGEAVTVSTNDKTTFRRIQPGQTSLTNAEQITFAEVKVSDRVLVPGGVTADQIPARQQVIIMARAAITAQRDQEREARRARTTNGRITAINAEKKEITIQSRGRFGNANANNNGNATANANTNNTPETITVSTSGNVKFLRYAPDSIKVSDAVAGSFADLKVGEQIRILGNRSADGASVTAEEIFSGSIMRTVGSIIEVNAARNEIVVKSGQNGKTITVALGKNTTLKRITPEVAETLKQRAERRRERTNQQGANNSGNNSGDQSTQEAQGDRQNRQNRRANRNADGQQGQGQGNQGQGQGNRGGGFQQQFDNLPTVTIAELKKGDAVLITGTGGTDNSRMTAVSITAGDADLQQILQRTQGGRNGNSPNSPGLPGNASGGNSANDNDEPRK